MTGKRIHTVDTLDLDPFADEPCVKAAITALEDSWEQVAGERLRDGAGRLLVEAVLLAFTMSDGLEVPARRHLKAHADGLMDEAAAVGLRVRSRRLPWSRSPSEPVERALWFERSVDALGRVWSRVEGGTLGNNAKHVLTETALVAFALAGGLERLPRDRLKSHAAEVNTIAAGYGLKYSPPRMSI